MTIVSKLQKIQRRVINIAEKWEVKAVFGRNPAKLPLKTLLEGKIRPYTYNDLVKLNYFTEAQVGAGELKGEEEVTSEGIKAVSLGHQQSSYKNDLGKIYEYNQRLEQDVFGDLSYLPVAHAVEIFPALVFPFLPQNPTAVRARERIIYEISKKTDKFDPFQSQFTEEFLSLINSGLNDGKLGAIPEDLASGFKHLLGGNYLMNSKKYLALVILRKEILERGHSSLDTIFKKGINITQAFVQDFKGLITARVRLLDEELDRREEERFLAQFGNMLV